MSDESRIEPLAAPADAGPVSSTGNFASDAPAATDGAGATDPNGGALAEIPSPDTEAAAGSADAASSGSDAAAGAPAGKISARPKQTLAGRVWVAIGFAVLILVLVIIFIAENSRSVTISFLGAHGHISLALALLIAVVGGIAITLLVGTARILQLRLEVGKVKREIRRLS